MARHHQVLLLAALAGACARPAAPPVVTTPAPVVTGTISADELRRDLFVFASDSFRGRESGTPDAMRSARFIADRLQTLGVEPAGDSGYFQRVPLQRESFGPATRFSVTSGGQVTDLPLERALVPLLNLGEGAPAPKLAAEGDVVFVGYHASPMAPPAINIRNKVAVVLHGAPPGADSATRARLESAELIGTRIGSLIGGGPAAIVLLMHDATEKTYTTFAPELAASMRAASAGPPPSDAERPLPMILIGLAREAQALLPADWRAGKLQTLAGRRFTGRVELRSETVMGHNVVGIVRGSDPRLSRTFVALGAHHDHVGLSAPVDGDSIANGADDDGSGTVALLAVARALQQSPAKPRRSVLFVWHAAEEKGLLGSEHFVERPTVPIDSIVAQINADMIGRNGAERESSPIPADAASRIFIVGPAAAPNRQSRTLGAIVDSVNAHQPQPFTFDRTWDSPSHPEQIYTRSDHYSYAKKGIPVVFLTTGLHADYHKVSDHPDKIDYDKLARVSRLLLDVTAALGNRATRPR